MTEYPTYIHDEVQPLPPSIDQAELNGRRLYVIRCLTHALAEQLVELSRQPHIAEYCPNDAAERFASMESVKVWQSKGRLCLPLVRQLGAYNYELAGFAWTGPGRPAEYEPDLSGLQTTFAVRIYESALGQGNALPYVKTVVTANELLHDNSGLWLEAWKDNASAIRTYEKAGFEHATEAPGMRSGAPASRVFMRLGATAARQLPFHSSGY